MQLQLAESERHRVKLEEERKAFESEINALRQTLDSVVSHTFHLIYLLGHLQFTSIAIKRE
jgi:myosin protein heavy chain